MSKAVYDVVSGASRKVKKQYAVIGGVTRAIKKSYDVVSGAARLCYTSAAAIAITGSGIYSVSTRASVTVDGTTYTGAASLEAAVGTKLSLYAASTVTIDGTTVLTGGGTYEYTVTGNTSIVLYAYQKTGTVTVTTV